MLMSFSARILSSFLKCIFLSGTFLFHFPLLSHKLRSPLGTPMSSVKKESQNSGLLVLVLGTLKPADQPAGPPLRGLRGCTFGAVIDDILAEQIIVTEDHRGLQLGQVFLQPGQLLFQHLHLRDICRKARQWQEKKSCRSGEG